MSSNYESLPVNIDNEAQLILSAIKNENILNKFVKQVTYNDFRTREFKMLAWAILELARNKNVVDMDSVFIKSKASPLRKFTFEKADYESIFENVNVCHEDNFDEFVRQLKEDGVRADLVDKTFTSWYLVETNLEVASSLEDIPQTGSGNPKIGKFTYKTEHDPMVTEFTYVVPRGSGMLYIAAHAVVFHDVGEGYCETAWGQGPTHQQFPGRSWALYFTYPAPA